MRVRTFIRDQDYFRGRNLDFWMVLGNFRYFEGGSMVHVKGQREGRVSGRMDGCNYVRM